VVDLEYAKRKDINIRRYAFVLYRFLVHSSKDNT